MAQVRPRSPSGPPHPLLRRHRSCFVLLFRVVSLIVAFQVSGAAHLLGDAVEIVTLGHHPDETNSHEDDPNHQCPPGCPTCHHAHAGNASLPIQVSAPDSCVPLAEGIIVLLGYDGNAPSIPDPTSVYRPPRAASRHA